MLELGDQALTGVFPARAEEHVARGPLVPFAHRADTRGVGPNDDQPHLGEIERRRDPLREPLPRAAIVRERTGAA